MKKKNKTTKMLTHDIPLRLIKILSICLLYTSDAADDRAIV